MKVRPLQDRILVKVEDQKETTKSGLYIPDTAKDSAILEGVVVATGEGRWDEDGKKRVPMEVRKSDKVLFGKYAGNEFKIDEVEHRILREEDLLGVVEK